MSKKNIKKHLLSLLFIISFTIITGCDFGKEHSYLLEGYVYEGIQSGSELIKGSPLQGVKVETNWGETLTDENGCFCILGYCNDYFETPSINLTFSKQGYKTKKDVNTIKPYFSTIEILMETN